jgi:hypothetical protein
MPWILALCFADGVFKDYRTPEELWRQLVPANRGYWEIRYKDEFLDWHVFRPRSSSREPFTDQHWETLWFALLRRAGYPEKITIHRIRQEASMLVDASGATALQHQHLLGQSREVAADHYRHNLTSIDLESLFLGQPQRQAHIQRLQGLNRTRIGGIPTVLPPSKAWRATQDSRELQELFESRKSRIAAGFGTHALDLEIGSARRTVLAEAYKVYLSDWIEMDYQLSIGNLGS